MANQPNLKPEMLSADSRREWVKRLGGGLGGVALAQLLGQAEAFASVAQAMGGRRGSWMSGIPKAKRVIQLFMNGGASQMDLFDYKPELFRRHGEVFNPGSGVRVEAATSEPGKVLKPTFEFKQHGQSGRWVSALLPHLSRHVDELAFLMSMTSRTNVHGPGSYLMNTGFLLPGFPSMGSWISYGLGRITEDLPSFVVLPDPKGLPYNQRGNFGQGFLPVQHQGTVVQAGLEQPMEHLRAPASAKYVTEAANADGLKLLQHMNRSYAERDPSDLRLDGRIQAYELAARMQLSAPEVLDLRGESAAVRAAYGLEEPATADFGKRCLLARRMVERGVRFVQVWSGAGGPTGNWDNHTSIPKELPPMCASIDRPIAALLADLKARGMMEDTLVLWNTEFGRMPFSQGSDGRDHNGGTFVGWMAGAGVRPGVSYGESDEWSWKGGDTTASTYDFHATVLHLLGLDHEKLTVRHGGADRRLTDVHGHVIQSVLEG